MYYIGCILSCLKNFDFLFQGANISQLERDIGADQFPPNEHYFGLVNVSFLFTFPQVTGIPRGYS